MIIFNVQAFESVDNQLTSQAFIYIKFPPSLRDSFDSSVGRAEDCSG